MRTSSSAGIGGRGFDFVLVFMLYSSSLTFSIQSTFLPFNLPLNGYVRHPRGGCSPMPVFDARRYPDDIPGLISCFCPPACWIQPVPAVTIRIWPSGWVCHTERAPGSNVT